MAIRQTKKISELPALTTAPLDTTYVVGISGSTTYKISISQLTSSLDGAFATDLVTNALSGNLDGKLSTSSFNSYTQSISTASLVTSISNLNTFTASQSTSSLVSSINNLNQFTASQSTGSLISSINELNSFTSSQITLNTAFTNGINARLQTTDYNTFSASVHTEIVAATNEQSLAHLVLTASFNTYTASISTGSLVDRLNTLESEISSSISYVYVKHTGVQISPASGQFFKPNDFVSGSINYDVSTGYFTLLSGKTYLLRAAYSFYDDNSNESTHGWYDVTNNTYLNAYGNYPQPIAETIITPNTNIQIGVKNGRLGTPTIDNSTSYILIQELGLGIVEGITGSTDYTQITNKPTLISGSSQLTSSLDNRYILESETSSFELTGRGIISGSSQLAAYYETIASSTHILISGSSQLTSSYDSRYVLETETSSFETTGRGIVSGSAQLNVLGYATTGSNTFTGLQTLQSVQEIIALKPSLGLGTNNFDFNNGSIFYIAGLTGSGTWNIQNIPSASNSATSLTFVIEQGATAYSASAYQLGGTSVSVKWLDGLIPTGSANTTDIIGLTAFRSGSSYNVIGSLSKFS